MSSRRPTALDHARYVANHFLVVISVEEDVIGQLSVVEDGVRPSTTFDNEAADDAARLLG